MSDRYAHTDKLMTDLLERITAKLDELQALAEASTPGPWIAHEDQVGSADESWGWPAIGVRGDADAALIAAVASPDRVLAGIAEDREVLKRHRHWQPFPDKPSTRWCDSCEEHFDPWCPEVLSVVRRHGIEAS